jgi:hypothetical protein
MLESYSGARRKFDQTYPNQGPPIYKTVTRWDEHLGETGSVLEQNWPLRYTMTQDNAERIRELFQRSPRKCIYRESLELDLPNSTVHDVSHKRQTACLLAFVGVGDVTNRRD